MHAYCWDDQASARREIGEACDRLKTSYSFDPELAVLAGFSQGAALAAALALDGSVLPCRRFLAVASSFPDPAMLEPLIERGVGRGVTGWLLTGEHDYGRARAEQVYLAMRRHGLSCELTVVPGMHHDVPRDFAERLGWILANLRLSGSQ